MAKIKFGAIVTDARNKLGGHVFSKNRAGAYLRTLVTPTNPQTQAQTSVRALFGQISQGWSSLTELQRNAWREAVELWQRTDIFGDLKRPTGKALHQRLNQQAVTAGYPQINNVPDLASVESNIASLAVMSVSSGLLATDLSPGSGNSRVMFFATPQLTQGTKFVKNKLRLITTQLDNALDDGTLYAAYVQKFGTPAEGDNIYLAVKYVNATGNSTPLQTLKITVNP
jgi:hypothetical protein